MFPIRVENPAVRPPLATLAIIVLNFFVWGFIEGFGDPTALARSLCFYALIPGGLLDLASIGTVIPLTESLGCSIQDGSAITLITHMFLHGGWFHLLGNMWFLWLFGNSVEDAMGPLRFILFYLFCGLAAAAMQIISEPGALVPMAGASGAIGGILGAYMKLYPQTRVVTVLFFGFYFTTVNIPAIAMLGFWFVLQLAGAFPLFHGVGSVAFFAHIGGFLAGFFFVSFVYRPDDYRKHFSLKP